MVYLITSPDVLKMDYGMQDCPVFRNCRNFRRKNMFYCEQIVDIGEDQISDTNFITAGMALVLSSALFSSLWSMQQIILDLFSAYKIEEEGPYAPIFQNICNNGKLIMITNQIVYGREEDEDKKKKIFILEYLNILKKCL